MSTHKHFDKICCVVLAFVLILTLVFMNAEHFGVQKVAAEMGYVNKLFDTSKVHSIDIVIDDWEEFTENCMSEEYNTCAVVIDGEAYKNVAIRGKGNTSLTQVNSYGNGRYSYKIEFDHYDDTNTYYGLDKLCLNNIIQDNTYMKDYLTYQMMGEMGVAAPLCSYAYLTVNGEDWGLYLAVEAVEESFLQRNYGNEYGELYKPDSMNMGGGRGNGKGFDMDKFMENTEEGEAAEDFAGNTPPKEFSDEAIGQKPGAFPGGPNRQKPDAFSGDPNSQKPGTFPGEPSNQMPDAFPDEADRQMPDASSNGDAGQMPRGMKMGSEDVLLKYIDDNVESYANIFDNAKTDVTNAEKTRLIESLKRLSAGEELAETVDIETVIRYFVVHNFVLNFDSYTGSMIHNYYLYEENGQMEMIPWDYNLAFGGFMSVEDSTTLVNYPIDSPVSGGTVEERPMIAWIFANEEYTELYHQYFDEFISTYFENGYFENMIDEVTAMIAPYVEKDPTKFCSYEEFETGANTLQEFCMLRAESIRSQLDGSIGSTTETQTESTLINADDLKIEEMGSMGKSMGGENRDKAFEKQFTPENKEDSHE